MDLYILLVYMDECEKYHIQGTTDGLKAFAKTWR